MINSEGDEVYKSMWQLQPSLLGELNLTLLIDVLTLMNNFVEFKGDFLNKFMKQPNLKNQKQSETGMKKIVMRFDKSKQKNNINKTNGGLNETIEI